jgi:hypothetical protein
MAFELKNVVPWGRTLEEYIKIFKLTDSDLNARIISFGDGPASFNSEMKQLDKTVVSLDPIYQFTKAELKQRINETKETVIEQIRSNTENYVWKDIKDVDQLEEIRMGAMSIFVDDFEKGKEQHRYIYHELPTKTKYDSLEFDLGLSSHFLILYSQLGLDFHIQSISEMLRICKEIRIFPVLNLNSTKSEVLEDIITHFNSDFEVSIESSDYEFQKDGNKMLVIKRKKNQIK